LEESLHLPLKAIVRDWGIWAICGLFLAIGLVALNATIVYNPDSARYLVWSQSLSQLRGFADLSIAEPFHYVVHAPLYSILLVPAALIAPGSIIAGKLSTLLMGAVLLFLLYWWLRPRVSRPVAVGAILILALHPFMVLFSNQILSDIPFGLAMVGAFLVMERLDAGSEEKLQQLLPLAGLLTAGIFLREVGITLYLAAVVYFLARRRYKSALFIFIVPMIFYLLWFLRNEVIVAGAEHPPLRNSEIFTLHYFTDRQASLFAELFARLKINLGIYWNHITHLLFLPQYGMTPYGVFIRSAPPYSTAMAVAGPISLVIVLISMAAVIYGLWVSARNQSTAFFLAFVPVYLLLIFFYPFNDVRFMFPLLLFMVYYGAQGVEAALGLPAMERRRKIYRPVALAVVVLLMVPNLSWCYAFDRDNARYRSSPAAFYSSIVNDPRFPDLLTKPTGEAGQWLVDHGAADAHVLTQWKELTFWLPKGKLHEVNTLVPLDELERAIRDYRINYVLSAVGLAGIPEFYAQMVLSKMYRFDSVFRVSNFEIFRIRPAAGEGGVHTPPDYGVDTLTLSPDVRRVWADQLRNRTDFARGLQAITEGRIDTAISIFNALSIKTRGSLLAVLHLAIAYEFAGKYDAAEELLKGLQRVKQSGAFLGHSTDHLEIISLLQRAQWEKNPAVKAEYYNVVSIKLWGLGFRRQAFQSLRQSLQVDPAFFPGMIFGIYFNLQENRLDTARTFFRQLMMTRPDHPLILQFETILNVKDSLQAGKIPAGRQSGAHLRIAAALLKAGLGDGAIDELTAWLKSDPNDEAAWMTLSGLYSGKFRYAPALWAAEEALKLRPDDSKARNLVDELRNRW